MDESLLSVGLDVGTTTTQMIVSRLYVKNQASSFAVPEMEITDREILYRSPIHFTPLSHEKFVDGPAIRALVEAEYAKAGITPGDVQTGAVIITGETSRKENAQAVLESLSDFAGDFVVATAGPDLESILAAKGAGAVAYSQDTHQAVLHMDIGGGTSNLALIEAGKVTQTGCLNVGGRLLKLSPSGQVTYVSPELKGLTDLQVGDAPTTEKIEAVAELLTQGLEMAAGLRPATDLLEKLMTREVVQEWKTPQGAVISFSGGVADCIEKSEDPLAFGDIGPVLGKKIKESALCKGSYILGKETIRATVIGAGCHSAQLSGSTVFFQDARLPVKNLQVSVFTREEQSSPDFSATIAKALSQKEVGAVALFMPGFSGATYAQVSRLAQSIHQGAGDREIYLCLEADMAKALGQCLYLMGRNCLCIDRVKLSPESYLDIGLPVGPALPVVVKTLILEHG